MLAFPSYNGQSSRLKVVDPAIGDRSRDLVLIALYQGPELIKARGLTEHTSDLVLDLCRAVLDGI